jgi:hypothetical protein
VAKKYPLETLRRLRADAVDGKAKEVSDAVHATDRANAERAAREKARADHASETHAIAEREMGELESGTLTAADLARAAAWSLGAKIVAADHARRVEDADSVVRTSVAAEVERRGELANAQASSEVVERNRSKWRKKEDERTIAADEEAAEDAFLARQHRGDKE